MHQSAFDYFSNGMEKYQTSDWCLGEIPFRLKKYLPDDHARTKTQTIYSNKSALITFWNAQSNKSNSNQNKNQTKLANEFDLLLTLAQSLNSLLNRSLIKEQIENLLETFLSVKYTCYWWELAKEHERFGFKNTKSIRIDDHDFLPTTASVWPTNAKNDPTEFVCVLLNAFPDLIYHAMGDDPDKLENLSQKILSKNANLKIVQSERILPYFCKQVQKQPQTISLPLSYMIMLFDRAQQIALNQTNNQIKTDLNKLHVKNINLLQIKHLQTAQKQDIEFVKTIDWTAVKL